MDREFFCICCFWFCLYYVTPSVRLSDIRFVISWYEKVDETKTFFSRWFFQLHVPLREFLIFSFVLTLYIWGSLFLWVNYMFNLFFFFICLFFFMDSYISSAFFQFYTLGDFHYIYCLFSYFSIKMFFLGCLEIFLCLENFVRFSYLCIRWAFSRIFHFCFCFIIKILFVDVIISYSLLIFLAFQVFTLTALLISSRMEDSPYQY